MDQDMRKLYHGCISNLFHPLGERAGGAFFAKKDRDCEGELGRLRAAGLRSGE